MKNYEEIKNLSLDVYNFVTKELFETKIADGKILLTNGIYVNIDTYNTKVLEECLFESHKKYIDIQIILEGQEIIIENSILDLKNICPYSEEKDIIFYENNKKGKKHILNKGDFVIFYPSQAHMPCVCIENSEKVRKAVVKIPVELIKDFK